MFSRALTALRSLFGSSVSPTPSAAQLGHEFATFDRVVMRRRAARAFQKDVELPERLLGDSLRLAQRSASGFNLQPYRIVVARDGYVRKRLSRCMVGGNIRRVLDAPAAVVFLADLEPWKLIEPLVDLERRNGGLTEHQLDNLRSDCQFLLGNNASQGLENEIPSETSSAMRQVIDRYVENSTAGRAIGQTDRTVNATEMAAKRTLLGFLSNFTQTPTLNSSIEAWSFKNTMLAAQTFMLAVSAAGFETCPMEGFDGRRVKEVLSVPDDRFSIPIVICVGREFHIAETVSKKKPRFNFEQVVSMDSFDVPMRSNV